MRSRRSVVASLLLVANSLAMSLGPVAADQESLCGDIQLIHARGIGDVANDQQFFDRVNEKLRRAERKIRARDRASAAAAHAQDGRAGSGGLHDLIGQALRLAPSMTTCSKSAMRPATFCL